MPEPTLTDVLVQGARTEGKLDAVAAENKRAHERLDVHGARLDKLERIAYVALGVALASGAPQLVGVFSR